MRSAASLEILGLLVISWAGSGLAQSGCNRNYSQNYTASPHHRLVLSSPNYPRPYDDLTDCLWMIQTDFALGPDFIVKVTFDDFQLEDGSVFLACDFDSLTFYDGPPAESYSHLLGKYCGTIHPDVIYSTGRYLYVKFDSDGMTTRRGFSFYYQAVNTEEAPAICRAPYSNSNVLRLNGSCGAFFSPDYPVPYPSYATCIWLIAVPPGKSVKLAFEDFALSDCRLDLEDFKDYVEIRDDLSSRGVELGRYNCDYTPPDVYSTGRYMWVKFHSSFSSAPRKKDKGFKAHFQAVDPPNVNYKEVCLLGNRLNNNLALNGYNGTLKSPPFYTSDFSCSWLITVPCLVKLSFDRFDLYWRASWCGDYVEALDGQYTSNKSLAKYCAYSTPKAVLSSGRYMRVNFRSYYPSQSATHDGFLATFKAVDVDYRKMCLPGSSHNKTLKLNGDNGTLKSPPFYPPDISCSWLITVPEGKIVKLSFNRFNLYWRAGECGDYVEALDGQYTSSKSLAKYCAYSTPKAVLSSGRYMRVNFRSDYQSQSATHEGFLATFKAVDNNSSSATIVIGVTVGLVVFILLSFCIICAGKKIRNMNSAAGETSMPMATTTTPAPHNTRSPPSPRVPHDPSEDTSLPPPVGYVPLPTNPPDPPPAYPYPLDSPPPYPGKEGPPQYPPPGESYPWLQNNASVQPSVLPEC